MSGWRAAGLNYINYSTIASKLLRKALKKDLQAGAMKRDVSNVKFTKWIDGKAQKREG